jgi:hypothetical protein
VLKEKTKTPILSALLQVIALVIRIQKTSIIHMVAFDTTMYIIKSRILDWFII